MKNLINALDNAINQEILIETEKGTRVAGAKEKLEIIKGIWNDILEKESSEEDKLAYKNFILDTLERNLEKAIQDNRAAFLQVDGEKLEYDDILMENNKIFIFCNEEEIGYINLNKIYYVKWFKNKLSLEEN